MTKNKPVMQYHHDGEWWDEKLGPLFGARYEKYRYRTPEGYAPMEWREKPMKNRTKGLYDKFIVLRKHDATPVQYPTFVLRIDGTDPIAMEALRTYALKCDEPLSSSLLKHIEDNPIRLTPQQIIEKSGYILDMFVEGVDDGQYAILQDLLQLAKEGLKKDE